MRVDFTFKHVDSSDALREYASERLEKLERYALNPMQINFTVSQQRHECTIEAHVLEGRRKFKALATSDDFYRAVEMVINKLTRQLSKDKRRLKNHHKAERSDYGQMHRLNEDLSQDFVKPALRKAS